MRLSLWGLPLCLSLLRGGNAFEPESAIRRARGGRGSAVVFPQYTPASYPFA